MVPHAVHPTQPETTAANAQAAVAAELHWSAERCTRSNSTKEHSWQFVSSGNVANYRGLCFCARFGEKICHLSSDDFCNHALKLIDCCPHVLVKITLLCGKTNGNETCVDKNNKQLRMHTTLTSRDPVKLRANPPGGANMM